MQKLKERKTFLALYLLSFYGENNNVLVTRERNCSLQTTTNFQRI